MNQDSRISLSLLLLRLGVFVLMFMWTIDKFVQPQHATAVYANFYFISGLGPMSSYLIGAVEMVILIGFLIGFRKRFTYGVVLLFHAVSTFSSFRQYLDPFSGSHLLFFAAWPALAACFALYYLRDLDTRLVMDTGRRHQQLL
jgi:putative oxidoreductase